MSLKRPKGMRAYFKNIQERTDGGARFETDFDQFYLCLMVGLDDGHLGKESDLEGAEFVKVYTSAYRPYAPVLAGMLVEAEMRRSGIPATKTAVQREILDIIDVSAGGTELKEDATTLLSRYAARGFEIIQKAIPKPQTLEDFLVAYHGFWQPPETDGESGSESGQAAAA